PTSHRSHGAVLHVGESLLDGVHQTIDSCLDTISNCSELGGQSRSPPRDRSHGVVLHTGEPRLDLIYSTQNPSCNGGVNGGHGRTELGSPPRDSGQSLQGHVVEEAGDLGHHAPDEPEHLSGETGDPEDDSINHVRNNGVTDKVVVEPIEGVTDLLETLPDPFTDPGNGPNDHSINTGLVEDIGHRVPDDLAHAYEGGPDLLEATPDLFTPVNEDHANVTEVGPKVLEPLTDALHPVRFTNLVSRTEPCLRELAEPIVCLNEPSSDGLDSRLSALDFVLGVLNVLSVTKGRDHVFDRLRRNRANLFSELLKKIHERGHGRFKVVYGRAEVFLELDISVRQPSGKIDQPRYETGRTLDNPCKRVRVISHKLEQSPKSPSEVINDLLEVRCLHQVPERLGSGLNDRSP